MKRSFCLLFSLIMTFVMCSCRRVNLSCADELVSRDWYSESKNGMVCNINFDIDNDYVAISLSTSSPDEIRMIKGTLAVDNERFYITSTDTCKTYDFAYEVYHDRAYITYGTTAVEFYPSAHIGTQSDSR